MFIYWRVVHCFRMGKVNRIMKIATWNLGRFAYCKTQNDIAEIYSIIKNSDADIFVLTELPADFKFPFNYFAVKSTELSGLYEFANYKQGECRVSIYSKNQIKKIIPTYDWSSAICIQTEIENKLITVYGSIIGQKGNVGIGANNLLEQDLNNQSKDWQNLIDEEYLFICGDFNQSFNSFPSFSKKMRNQFLNIFDELKLELLTTEGEIDHIATKKEIAKNHKTNFLIWNNEPYLVKNRKLSDHSGVMITLEEI